jgi:glycosyltransferase involved in cell wall biosynthesis
MLNEEGKTMSATLSVVIPAYNEEDGISIILDRILKVKPELKQIGVATEVIVVDDGSKDKTADIVRDFERKDSAVRLLQHKINKNYGGALKTGFKNAKGDLLAFLDADGTYPPEYFPKMCQEMMKGADMVVASRMAGDKNESPMVRQVGNFLFAGLVSIIGNRRVTDVGSGMRVFRRSILDKLYPLPDGLNFTPVMSVRAVHENIKLVEISIPHSEREGRSKLSVIKDGMRFLNGIVWTALMYNPVRILGLIGMAFIAIAAVIFGGLLASRLSGVTNISNVGAFGVFAMLALAVTGVSLFNLGAMFNYLVSLFYKRPIRQGLFGKPVFAQPLDQQFWWIGGLCVVLGILVGVGSLSLSFGGWDMNRLWMWLAGGAALILIGVQFIVSFFVMRTLDELSQREGKVDADLMGKEIK